MQTRRFASLRSSVFLTFTICLLAATGCRRGSDASVIGTFTMGEKVQTGPLVYSILETDWKASLSDGGRVPANRFFFVKVTITNQGKQAVAVPGLTLQGPGGKIYTEQTENMQGVSNWLGLLRNLQPSQTMQGWVVFDAPMAAYKIVVSDGGEIGNEKHALIDIPVQLPVQPVSPNDAP